MFITVNYASVAFHRHPTRQEHSIHVHTACTGTASEYINYSGSTMIIKPFKSYSGLVYIDIVIMVYTLNSHIYMIIDHSVFKFIR